MGAVQLFHAVMRSHDVDGDSGSEPQKVLIEIFKFSEYRNGPVTVFLVEGESACMSATDRSR